MSAGHQPRLLREAGPPLPFCTLGSWRAPFIVAFDRFSVFYFYFYFYFRLIAYKQAKPQRERAARGLLFFSSFGFAMAFRGLTVFIADVRAAKSKEAERKRVRHVFFKLVLNSLSYRTCHCLPLPFSFLRRRLHHVQVEQELANIRKKFVRRDRDVDFKIWACFVFIAPFSDGRDDVWNCTGANAPRGVFAWKRIRLC